MTWWQVLRMILRARGANDLDTLLLRVTRRVFICGFLLGVMAVEALILVGMVLRR